MFPFKVSKNLLSVSLILVLSFSGSQAQAVLTLKSGKKIEGEIAWANDSLVAVNRNRELIEIPRMSIKKINHPGKAGMFLGYGIASMGLIVLNMNYFDTNKEEGLRKQVSSIETSILELAAFPLIIFGMWMGVYHTKLWNESRSKLQNPSGMDSQIPESILPILEN